jgi:hypothetical protein
MTEIRNNKQKNKKMALALVWNLRFVIYLKFGACDLLFI